MRTLKIDVSDNIYEHIIFFLKSIPSNLINIRDEKNTTQTKENSTKQQLEELFRVNSNIEPFQEIDNPMEWQKSMRNEWE